MSDISECVVTKCVYIVTKAFPGKLEGVETKVNITFNEGVFETEELAKEYIKARKKLKDRDDRGCKFNIEPWAVTNKLPA